MTHIDPREFIGNVLLILAGIVCLYVVPMMVEFFATIIGIAQ